VATPNLYGTGLDVTSGWPYRFVYASGFRNLGNNLARRLQTPRGQLAWDPDCGWDVRQLFRGSLTEGELSRAEGEISAECQKDERVDSASVVLTYVAQAETLIIKITVDGADGPFALILSVDSLTVTILRLSQGQA